MILFVTFVSIIAFTVGFVMTVVGFGHYISEFTVYNGKRIRGKQACEISVRRIGIGVANIMAVIMIITFSMKFVYFSLFMMIAPFVYYLFRRGIVQNYFTYLTDPLKILFTNESEIKFDSNIRINELDVGGYMATRNNSRDVGIGDTKEEAIKDFKNRIN